MSLQMWKWRTTSAPILKILNVKERGEILVKLQGSTVIKPTFNTKGTLDTILYKGSGSDHQIHLS